MACVFYFLPKLLLVMPNGWYFLKELETFKSGKECSETY